MLLLSCSFAFVVFLFGATILSTALGRESPNGPVGSDNLLGHVHDQTEDVNNEGNPTERESERLSRSIGAIKDHGKIKIGAFQSIQCEGLLKHNGRKIREATNYTPELGIFTQLKCSGLENYFSSKIKPFKGFDCLSIQQHYGKSRVSSGVYTIYPKGDTGVDVFCDMETDGGGWTVIHRRFNGKEMFNRNWKDYKDGFGNKSEDYWLGNDNIHVLTSNGTCQLRMDLKDSKDHVRYAKYKTFKVSDESGKYRLTISAKTSGDVYHDAMAIHNGKFFSTKDRDNDENSRENCAAVCYGGWWYEKCYQANLNGMYTSGQSTHTRYNVWTHLLKGSLYNLRSSTMMIRRI